MVDPVVIGGATLYLGDCMEILPHLPQVDACITDPPYGINWKPRKNHRDGPWTDDKQINMSAFLLGNYQIFWGAQYFCNDLPIYDGWLVWLKRPVNLDFKNDNRTYSSLEMAWRNFGKAKFMCHVWDGGMRAGVAENRTFCHPSQKPLEVMRWCLDQLPDDCGPVVLDPFMGSGTTGVACVQLGRKFIGIEKERQYFDIACERIERAQKQGQLFEPTAPKAEQETLL